MFTEKVQLILDRASEIGVLEGKKEIDLQSLLNAMAGKPEGIIRLAECFTGGEVERIKTPFAIKGETPGPNRPFDATSLPFDPSAEKILPNGDVREVLSNSIRLASAGGVPDRNHPGYVNVGHLACGLALSDKVQNLFFEGQPPLAFAKAIEKLKEWESQRSVSGAMTGLFSDLRNLRSELLRRVFGQDHAIHAFIEGIYNAEVTASIDKQRKRPAAVFVFAGPPGVGKTYLAELSATLLNQPFKRFDMTGFTDHQAHSQLVGFSPSYQAAAEGSLTGFVAKNPHCILLFDEIEKAHLNTIQLFYQILDAGRLQDKFTEQEVDFKDTIIIFTTNAGSSIYNNPNRAGIGAANADYHRRTILNALENEKNPTTGQPAFPPAICSRLGQGYPLMFNQLGVNELVRIATAELNRTARLLEKQYLKNFTYEELLPITMVYTAGGRVDARELRADTEKFIKNELFKFAALYSVDRVEDVFSQFDRVHFRLEGTSDLSDTEVGELFVADKKPKILLVSGKETTDLFTANVDDVAWSVAGSKEEAAGILASSDIDMVLLDLWLPEESQGESESELPTGKTLMQDLDFVPLSAKALSRGREILRKIHESFPDKPVYLLSVDSSRTRANGERDESRTQVMDATVAWDQMEMPEESNFEPKRMVDEELFLACVRSGGARGLVTTDFNTDQSADWKERRDRFVEQLQSTSERIFREAKAAWLGKQRKVLSFDTAIELDSDNRQLAIRLRDFRLSRVIEASDTGEMVDDIQRPTTTFDDVIGATAAKESLRFVVDWLKDPGYYTALRVKPPKGVLMTGPPGTGKTMLARAVAGESDCAFMEKASSSFVTIWQGSGPQNVRDLFARARRYAPAIVFIDEIDAIGTKRSGGVGGARATEETLNALLTEMDGFTVDKKRPVIVLAATNLVERLDEALIRRFDRVIEVDRPDREARLFYLKKVFKDSLGKEIKEEVLKRMAGQAAGMTIADLERVIQEAAVIAARAKTQMDGKILESAFEKIRMGEATKPPSHETLERIARHEAGHTLISWTGGSIPVQVTIVGRGGAGGYMESEQDEDKIILSKNDMLQRIRMSMGGRAAEIHYYGLEEGLSSGASGDLQKATSWALKMVRELGMDDGFGYFSVAADNRGDYGSSALADKAAEAAEKIVRAEMNAALKLMGDHKKVLDELSQKLLEKNRLVREEIMEILK
jgi:cell division protease FtsH